MRGFTTTKLKNIISLEHCVVRFVMAWCFICIIQTITINSMNTAINELEYVKLVNMPVMYACIIILTLALYYVFYKLEKRMGYMSRHIEGIMLIVLVLVYACICVFQYNDIYFVAPEYVLLNQYDDYTDIYDRYSDRGERILVFGECVSDPQGNIIEEPVIPYAFIILENEIRDTAKETFGYFEKQGVDVVVISGDNPVTASKVAIRAGIRNAENYVDATTLKNEADIKAAIQKYTVFGRVIPEQKKQIIQAYKAAGRVVAMTGDGVNDVLALKCADCSVAMASGSDAASNAAQIVLLDSDFSKMPDVVLEGRRVVNNIQTSASLFLVKNIFSILTTVFTLIAANLYPLYPTQLSLLGAFTIGTPAFVLALQPNKELIRGDFLVNVILKALPAGLADFIMLAAISIHGNILGMSNEQISTVAIVILLFIGLAALVRICRPFDGIRILLCLAMAAGIVICVLNFKGIFAITTVNMTMLRMIIMYALIAGVLFCIMCKSVGGWIDYMERHSKRFRRLLKG